MPDDWVKLNGWLKPLAVVVGVGAWARYAVAWLVAGLSEGAAFPWPTFGISGGFTTFSTFSIETLELIEKDRLGLAVLYASGSVAAGLMGAMLAVRIAKGL